MRLLLMVLTLCFFTQAFAQTEPTIYTEDKTGIAVTKDGPKFVIKLKSNPTTGYSWFLREYDSSKIQPLKHTFEPPTDTKLMGAPGFELWTFSLKPVAFVVPQQILLRFVYSRPWEGNNQSKQIVFSISTVGHAQ